MRLQGQVPAGEENKRCETGTLMLHVRTHTSEGWVTYGPVGWIVAFLYTISVFEATKDDELRDVNVYHVNC